jgi:hypothetical protein
MHGKVKLMNNRRAKTKDEMEEAETAWDRKAMTENIRCPACSQRIPYFERDLFFSKGCCGACLPSSN